MANTFSSALVTDVAEETALTVLQNKLASLNSFSTDFSTDVVKPRATIQVPLVVSAAAGQKNATNFEQGDAGIDKVTVIPDQLSVSFHITNDEMQRGFRLAKLYNIHLLQLANMIMDAALTPVTVANYGQPVVAGISAANFGPDDLTLLYAAAKNFNQKNVVLDGSYLAQFIPKDKLNFKIGESGAYGFDLMSENNRWVGADAKVQGFVADPQALALGAGLSQIDPAVEKVMQTCDIITLDKLGGFSVRFCTWGSAATRNVWGAFDVMFGAAKGDASALKLVTGP